MTGPQQPGNESVLIEYLPKLIRLASRNMTARIQQKCGPDDMANSVLASVIRINREGKLKISIDESDDFWRLLVAISLQKIRKRVRHYETQQRRVDREISIEHLEHLVREQGDPSQDGADRLSNVLLLAQDKLDQDDQIILAGKLDSKRNIEIAEQLADGKGRSTKTVKRKWDRIKAIIQEVANDFDDD